MTDTDIAREGTADAPKAIAEQRAHEGTVTSTDGQLTVTPARPARKRQGANSGNPQADREGRSAARQRLLEDRAAKLRAENAKQLRDSQASNAATERDNAVLNGVSKPTEPTTQTSQGEIPNSELVEKAVQATVPAAWKSRPVGRGRVAPLPQPEAAPAPKPDKLAARHALARAAVQGYADAIQDRSEAEKFLAAQWIRHLPVGRRDDGTHWWPANLPVPDNFRP